MEVKGGDILEAKREYTKVDNDIVRADFFVDNNSYITITFDFKNGNRNWLGDSYDVIEQDGDNVKKFMEAQEWFIKKFVK